MDIQEARRYFGDYYLEINSLGLDSSGVFSNKTLLRRLKEQRECVGFLIGDIDQSMVQCMVLFHDLWVIPEQLSYQPSSEYLKENLGKTECGKTFLATVEQLLSPEDADNLLSYAFLMRQLFDAASEATRSSADLLQADDCDDADSADESGGDDESESSWAVANGFDVIDRDTDD